MNKKAQIAETLTWAVAFVIIVGLMLLFIVGVLFILPTNLGNKNQLNYVDSEFNSYDKFLKNALLIDEFANSNRETISDWSDGINIEDNKKIIETSLDEDFGHEELYIGIKIFSNGRKIDFGNEIDASQLIDDPTLNSARGERAEKIKVPLVIISNGGNIVSIEYNYFDY